MAKDTILVEVRGARYPGTNVSADFTCVIVRGATGSRMTLAMALGGFSARVPFEQWLAGSATMRGTVQFDALRLSVQSDIVLMLSGKATAVYDPSGVVQVRGRGIAHLQHGREVLVSDEVLLALPVDEPSVLAAGAARRTEIVLERGAHAWHMRPRLHAGASWQALAGKNVFDRVQLEYAELPHGARLAGMVAASSAGLHVVPHPSLKGADGRPYAVRLQHARYALAGGGSGGQSALVGQIHEQSAWLAVNGCAVELGGLHDTPLLVLQARGGALASVNCSPSLLRIALPVAGGTSTPTEQPAGTRLAIVSGARDAAVAQEGSFVRLGDARSGAVASLVLQNPTFAVVRPEDLLSLTFTFSNLQLDTAVSGKPPQLVPIVPQRPSHVGVHFQGQHIAEEAFYQVEPAVPVPQGGYPSDNPQAPSTPDPDAGMTNGEFPEKTPGMPAQSRLAGESRLVFTLPTGMASVPLTLEALLDWSQYTPSVQATAVPAGEIVKATIAEPGPTETALEIPWRLQISPNRYAAWLHSFSPVTHNGWTELWHTRLGVQVTIKKTAKNPGHAFLVDSHYMYEGADAPEGRKYMVTGDAYVGGRALDLLPGFRSIRAVWSQDYPQNALLKDNVPFRSSLTGQDRRDLVNLTSLFTRAAPPVAGPIGAQFVAVALPPYNPLPVQVNRLMLSTLGAWVDFHGAWSKGYHINIALEEWTHRATQGRDNYVRVVYKGYLFPFGHRASLVKITERKFYYQGGRNVAYLFQRMFIIVREPTKQFGDTKLQDATGRNIDLAMPFKTVEITTKTTPDLEPPKQIPGVGAHDTDAFWPQVASGDFLFHLVGQDLDGQRTEFTTPLAFISVEGGVAYDVTQMQTLEGLYKGSTGQYPARHTRSMGGAKVAFAQSNRPGDTTLHTTDVTFGAYVPTKQQALPDDQPRFYPVVVQATVGIPAVEAILKSGDKPQISFNDHYLQHGLGGANNPGEVFADIVGNKPPISFGSSNGGGTGTPGVVTPNLAISALSRVMGPIGGDPTSVQSIAEGNIPSGQIESLLSQFFDNDAKILGAIPLSKIINIPSSLGPIFQILNLVQQVQSSQDVLGDLISTALNQVETELTNLENMAQQQLASVEQQILSRLQGVLAPLDTALNTVKTPLTDLKNALNGIPSFLLDFLGDIGTAVTDVTKLLDDVSSVTSDLNTVLSDISTADLNKLSTDVAALKTPLTALPDDLKSLADALTAMDGMSPLPMMKHAQLPDAIDIKLNWAPRLQPFSGFVNIDKFLSVTITIHVPFDGSAPDFKIEGTLGQIKLGLPSPDADKYIILVSFGGMQFSASLGSKPEVTVGGVDVLFGGALAFVNDLKDAIPSDGFTDPPFVDVSSDGVSAGFTFDLPSIGVGMFSLENISLGAKVTIPFIGSTPAQVYFNFCTRESPFMLTVSMMGGGGFFGISVGLDGVDMIEAALEFGGRPLARLRHRQSGSVSVMGGVYFKLQKNPDQTIVTAFVHIHGEVDALAILMVSIDVELDLTYEKDGPDTSLSGAATLKITIKLVVLHFTVSASVHRQFSGSHNDPSFADQVSEADWNRYLKAFA